MIKQKIKIKLSYIAGLRPVVLEELKRHNFRVLNEVEDSVYLEFSEDIISEIKKLRSVARAYLVLQNNKFHPTYISNHKSILGNLVDIVIKFDSFKTFRVSCAGSDSPEAKNIAKYIQETFGLEENEEADLKIHLIKTGKVWEIGAQVTTRPLSVRSYKVVNMSGAMDPTIAYAANSLCNLGSARSYLNVFSGSSTLLIEAGQCYPNLQRLIGFDNDKNHLSLSVQNIKKAGLINQIQLKEANIFDQPDFGKFDAIVSDLPFGMSISKNEDLEKLYSTFVEYCSNSLNINGRMVVYTSKHELIKSLLLKSQFKIIQSLKLKFITNANVHLKPQIFVCELKKEEK